MRTAAGASRRRFRQTVFAVGFCASVVTTATLPAAAVPPVEPTSSHSATPSASASTVQPSSVTVTDPLLQETGSLAADPSRGVFWTANASSDWGTVYALDPDGNTAGKVQYSAPELKGIEAMAMHQGVLYVADIADPTLARPSVKVIRLDGLGYGGAAAVNSYDLIYPDGPHDARALTISPRGNIYVFTFEESGKAYRAALPGAYDAQVALEAVGDAPAWLTDAVFVDETTVAARTYSALLMLNAVSDFDVTASASVPSQRQGESIALAMDSERLVLGSKGTASNLVTLARPTSRAEVQPGSPTPPQFTPGATSGSASPTPHVTNDPGETKVNSNTTLIALGSAAALAIVGGVIAYRRDPR